MLGSMASGFKHFSHTHNLVMHEMHEGAEVSCSGCHSSATKTVYVCLQCGFYLHEQCFQATRSRKHPSHPMHPLTLVPFPTYPSNSFYCNSCKVIGTGFSYSCSECDFDLHVQCAYSISSATNFHQPNQITSHHNPHNLSYLNQEIALPMLPNVPSISFPTPIPIPTQIPVPQYPINNTQNSYMTQNVSAFSLPTSAQNLYIPQNSTSAPISAQISSIPQNGTLVFAQTYAPNSDSSSNYVESAQTWPKSQGIRHFSHPHGLVLVNIKQGKRKISCSGCQETIIGKGYACDEENCGFQIHESCFNLEKEIQHKSHPPHPLTLTLLSSIKEKGMLTCNACFKDCTVGFNYQCSICDYDLHVKCAIFLKETVKREDHEHELKLCYECPLKGEEYTFFCDMCNRVVARDQWTYYCKECDFGTHLDCVHREECDGTTGDRVVDAATMQMLEKMMETARINALSNI